MCTRTERLRRCSRQRGLSLIELIIFIVIVGIALAGVTATYNTVVRGSADPMIRKQALAIAESLLLEVEQQAFTWCDPQDANVATATGFAGCTTSQANLAGPSPSSEQRGNNINPFDNVADYGNFTASGSDIVGGNANATYTASVAITPAGGAGAFAGFPADAVLRIAVTVTGNGETVTLVGYRTRCAPNAAG